jgi:DNA-binding MarR family transcriptional regulator
LKHVVFLEWSVMNDTSAVVHPLPLCNGSSLRKAGRRLMQLYGEILAPCGLRQSQHSLLAHIARAGTPTMSQLANDMVLDRSALSHNLKPLERDGLVVLVADEVDRRSRRVRLTVAGQEKLAESTRLWTVAHTRFEQTYGVDKARMLRALLAEIYSDEFAERFETSTPKPL